MDKGLHIEKNISFNLLLEKLKENKFIKDLKKMGSYTNVFLALKASHTIVR